ncbi:hypothetical protein Fmac_021005 [Flemingia macrophylla]|uniref:Uncharacterized protein n=1 Tax=Flemingia macrophylla TaxID=520843 RepID=A0ABD1LVN4_9FABA
MTVRSRGSVDLGVGEVNWVCAGWECHYVNMLENGLQAGLESISGLVDANTSIYLLVGRNYNRPKSDDSEAGEVGRLETEGRHSYIRMKLEAASEQTTMVKIAYEGNSPYIELRGHMVKRCSRWIKKKLMVGMREGEMAFFWNMCYEEDEGLQFKDANPINGLDSPAFTGGQIKSLGGICRMSLLKAEYRPVHSPSPLYSDRPGKLLVRQVSHPGGKILCDCRWKLKRGRLTSLKLIIERVRKANFCW